MPISLMLDFAKGYEQFELAWIGTLTRCYCALQGGSHRRKLLKALLMWGFTLVGYDGASTLISPAAALAALGSPKDLAVRLEADYILACQHLDLHSPAYGAINNVIGHPTWVVPGENAMAIMGLVTAYQLTGEQLYLQRAQLAANYLINVQDTVNGAWYDQYSFDTPVTYAQSLRHTAEVMIALDKLGYDPAHYDAMEKATQFLFENQNPVHKGGRDDGLMGGGKDNSGNYHSWRWTSDNAYAYQALAGAAQWATRQGKTNLARQANQAASQILAGLTTVLIDPTGTHWTRVVDAEDQVIASEDYSDWISYAPLMLDIPLEGLNPQDIGNWIHQTLQKSDGALVWDNQSLSTRRSPGYSFQASLAWLNAGQNQYVSDAIHWAENSGLWVKILNTSRIKGGWIDWIAEPNGQAQGWERFIDTSAYYIMVQNGGFDFSASSP